LSHCWNTLRGHTLKASLTIGIGLAGPSTLACSHVAAVRNALSVALAGERDRGGLRHRSACGRRRRRLRILLLRVLLLRILLSRLLRILLLRVLLLRVLLLRISLLGRGRLGFGFTSTTPNGGHSRDRREEETANASQLVHGGDVTGLPFGRQCENLRLNAIPRV
jgi:hypothetical protein